MNGIPVSAAYADVTNVPPTINGLSSEALVQSGQSGIVEGARCCPPLRPLSLPWPLSPLSPLSPPWPLSPLRRNIGGEPSSVL